MGARGPRGPCPGSSSASTGRPATEALATRGRHRRQGPCEAPDRPGACSSGSRPSSKSPGVSRISDGQGAGGPQAPRERSRVYKRSHQPGVPDRCRSAQVRRRTSYAGTPGVQARTARCPASEHWRRSHWPTRTVAGDRWDRHSRRARCPARGDGAGPKVPPSRHSSGTCRATVTGPPPRAQAGMRPAQTARRGWRRGYSPQAMPNQNPGVGGPQATGSVHHTAVSDSPGTAAQHRWAEAARAQAAGGQGGKQPGGPWRAAQPLLLLPERGPRTERASQGLGGVVLGAG